MVTDEKRIINKGTDPLSHNIHREGRGRLTRPVPWIKTNHIHFGFIRACNDNSIQEIHNIFASRYTKSIPQTETKHNKLGFHKNFVMNSNV
jgi:hypothetical protein